MRVLDIIWVGVGGGIGSLLRWQIGVTFDRAFGSTFKIGTLFINVSGAFVIAYISAALAFGWEHRFGDLISSLVLTGVLGGYTTFSTMQLDAVKMSNAGSQVRALIYLSTSVCAGLLAAAAGVAIARA
jgi:CrcB protein